jgi:hypothetical protein
MIKSHVLYRLSYALTLLVHGLPKTGSPIFRIMLRRAV